MRNVRREEIEKKREEEKRDEYGEGKKERVRRETGGRKGKRSNYGVMEVRG